VRIHYVTPLQESNMKKIVPCISSGNSKFLAWVTNLALKKYELVAMIASCSAF